MSITDSVLFNTSEKWAVGAAEGFVHGRLPIEDKLPLHDFISRLTWPAIPGVPPPPLPMIKPMEPMISPGQLAARAGPFNMWAFKVPKAISDFFGLPPASTAVQSASIKTARQAEPLFLQSIPTCTNANIFNPLPPGKHPPHPIIQFSRPVDHVHVRLSNPSTGKLLWDASYDMKGGSLLDNRETIVPIPQESNVPDYIPPCTLNKSLLRLDVDAERFGPLQVQFLNPVSQHDDSHVNDGLPLATPAPKFHPMQQEMRPANAIICKGVQQGRGAHQKIIDLSPKHNVYLPTRYKEALIQIDHSRDPSSEINPHGVPMLEIAVEKSAAALKSLEGLLKMSPGSIGTGEDAIHLLARRPPLGGEIQVDQLERGNFGLFDSRKVPQDISLVDTTVILQRPTGFLNPTVERTVYSPMWQGVHDGNKNLHPSFQFKHPVSVVQVLLKDETSKEVVWDATFNVKGNHKIAADQNPIGGSKPVFTGINPPTERPHSYSLKIDADNPSVHLKDESDRVVNYWRQAEFIFGASRPTLHSEFLIEVKNGSGLGSWFAS